MHTETSEQLHKTPGVWYFLQVTSFASSVFCLFQSIAYTASTYILHPMLSTSLTNFALHLVANPNPKSFGSFEVSVELRCVDVPPRVAL